MAQDGGQAKNTDEMFRAAVSHSWDNEKGDFRHRRQFQDIGITSREELRDALDKAIKDKSTRSIDREPQPERNQTQRSTIFQAKLIDKQGREHQVTVILNPDRNERGELHGGTAYLNDPKRPLDIHRIREVEKNRGNEPKFVLREADLSRSAQEAIKSPVHRFLDNRPPPVDPRHAREDVTPTRAARPQQAPSQQAAPNSQAQAKNPAKTQTQTSQAKNQQATRQAAAQRGGVQAAQRASQTTQGQGKGTGLGLGLGLSIGRSGGKAGR